LVIEAVLPDGSHRLTIVRLGDPPEVQAARFAAAVCAGLAARPRSLPWQYFYDQRGSELFERICRLPEYYVTRTEDAILRDHAAATVAGWAQPPTVIELGSGSATKTQRLIGAALAAYGTLHYVPIDVSATILEESAEALLGRFPGLRVTGYVADYQTALARAAAEVVGPKLVVFLGSSLGNYTTDEAVSLLGRIAQIMGPDDRLLLGLDLAKDRALLEAAYDDAQGVTAQFNRNLLARINRELGADFDLDQFTHRACYRPELGRVEMHLVSRRDQVVEIARAGLRVRLASGEAIHTESSHKYTRETLRLLAERSGLREEAFWVDREGRFRLQRWRLRTSTSQRLDPR
jgi:dimethylhistidine N-methyltransferase